MWAPPLVYISPLIWPVLIPTMISEKLDERARKKQRADSAARYFAERMAICPPGYEAVFTDYYANRLRVPSKVGYSHEQAVEAYFSQLAAGNLPEDPELRKDILEMADYMGGSLLADLRERAEPLLSQDAPVLAGYAGGYILIRNMRFSLDRRDSNDEPYIVQALRDSARAFERHLAAEPSLRAPLSLGVLYGALARRLPEGPEREASRLKAIAGYKLTVQDCASFQEIWCALYGLLEFGVDQAEFIPLLDDVLADLRNGRKLEKDMPDYDLLPLAWGEAPIGYHEIHYRILEKLLALIPDEGGRVAASYRLMPMLYAYSDYFSPQREWRKFAYDRYLENGDIAWADLFLALAEGLAASESPEKRAGMRAAIGYYRAENAFMHGDLDKAARLIRHHYERDDNIGQFMAPSSSDPWTGSEAGQAFVKLDNAEYRRLMDERAARGGPDPQ